MPDNPRMPGHPSDMPSSRSSDGASNSSSPQQNFNTPVPQHPATPSPNNQLRNIIIGAIATVFASTLVYYLTQYMNRNKSDSVDSFMERKEATSEAWNSYVTCDNLYYKNMLILAKDKDLLANLDKLKTELSKETDKFIIDAENLSKKKNVDELFISLVNRRIDRERESEEYVGAEFKKIDSVKNTSLSDAEKRPLLANLAEEYINYTKGMWQRAANELDDLSKNLSDRYGKQLFNPGDFLFFSDYKKVMTEIDGDTTGSNKPVAFARNVSPKALVGKWQDNDNRISLLENNTMSFEIGTSEKDTGTWKIENDQLRLDAINLITKAKNLWLFNLSKITPRSFTMILVTKPFDTFNVVRVK